MVSMNKMLANADKLVAQVNGDVAPQVLAALQDARRTLATANGALAPDASLQQDTRRMMQELTELPLRCARSPTISSGIPKRSCKERRKRNDDTSDHTVSARYRGYSHDQRLRVAGAALLHTGGSPYNAATAVTGRASRTSGPLWIEVTPVRVPERLNRAQLVVPTAPAVASSSSTRRAGRLHCRTSYAMRCRSDCNRV
jgi:hypothetical protein